MHLKCQRRDTLRQILDGFRKLRVLLEHFQQQRGLLRGKCLLVLAQTMQVLAMFRIGDGVRLVAVGLTRLRQQNERRSIRRLQAEREVEQDERIDIKRCEPDDINKNPDRNDDRLPNKKHRRTKKPSKRLSLQGKPVITKNRSKMQMGQVKPVALFQNFGVVA